MATQRKMQMAKASQSTSPVCPRKQSSAVHWTDEWIINTIRKGSRIDYNDHASMFTNDQLFTMYKHIRSRGFPEVDAMEITAMSRVMNSDENPMDEACINVLKALKGITV